MLVYIEDLSQEDIFVLNAKLVKNTSKDENKSLNNFYICLESENILSLILETRLEYLASMYEEQVRHYLRRLGNILNQGVFVQGAGYLEESLIEIIQNLKIKENNLEEIVYFELAKEILSSSLNDFKCILVNSSNYNKNIYDDFKSKLEAWKTAFYLGNIFLNTDLSILS